MAMTMTMITMTMKGADGAVVTRWHSGHQCVPGSIPGVEVTCGLNWHVVG